MDAGSRDVFELRADREEVHARSARRPATAPPRVQASAFTSVVEPPTLPCVHEEVQDPVLSDADRLATVQQYHRRALKEQMQRVAGDRKPCSLRPRIRIWEQELAAVRIRLGRAKTPAKRLAAWQAVEQRFACCTKGRQPVAHAPEPVVAVDRPPQARHRPPPGVLPAQPASDASTHRQPPTASCVRAPKSLYGPCERSENSSPTRASHQSPSRPSRGMRTPIRGGFNSARVAPSLGSSTGATGTIPRRASSHHDAPPLPHRYHGAAPALGVGCAGEGSRKFRCSRASASVREGDGVSNGGCICHPRAHEEGASAMGSRGG